MLSFIQKTASYFVKEETDPMVSKVNTLIKEEQTTLVSVKELDVIAQSSFNIEDYEKIAKTIIEILESNKANGVIIFRTLVSVDYLIKFGSSGFIDEFRDHIYLFKLYAEVDFQKQGDYTKLVQKKANYIIELLLDKKKLYKEKEISKRVKMRLIERKDSLASFKNTSQKKQNQQDEEGKDEDEDNDKLDDILENYVFKYLDRLSDKADSWADSVNQKIDDYINSIGNNLNFSDNNEDIDDMGEYMPEQCIDLEDDGKEKNKGGSIRILKQKQQNQGKNQGGNSNQQSGKSNLQESKIPGLGSKNIKLENEGNEKNQQSNNVDDIFNFSKLDKQENQNQSQFQNSIWQFEQKDVNNNQQTSQQKVIEKIKPIKSPNQINLLD